MPPLNRLIRSVASAARLAGNRLLAVMAITKNQFFPGTRVRTGIFVTTITAKSSLRSEGGTTTKRFTPIKEGAMPRINMSDDQDTAQTLLLTLAEAERILTAMRQAQLLKEDLALVGATLDSAKRSGRAELLVVIKKDIYDIPAPEVRAAAG